MAAYYNDINPFAAAMLRELITDGLLPEGDVDQRDIREVQPSDLRGYIQCHFFAGIGGWPYALRLAGWPDDRPVWTASCPCQPISGAGKRKGHADKRHLWPSFFRVVPECAPPTIFGEQVASSDGYEWLAGIRADLEDAGYACGAADLCAASVSAPHVRQRLFWVANSERRGLRGEGPAAAIGAARGMQEADGEREWIWPDPRATGLPVDGVGNPYRYHRHWWSGPVQVGRNGIEGQIERGGRQYRAQWRLGPGIRIVADGIPNRVETLCGAGNAIIPQVAAEFIQAYLDATM